MSQRELATRVAIDVTYLSKIENGRQIGSEKVLRSLEEHLHLEPGELLARSGRVPEGFQQAFDPEMVELTRPATVPVYPTSFINRFDEMAHVKRLWQPGALVTITGPPGCGKTRLASQLVLERASAGTTVTWLEVREGDDAQRLAARLDAGDVGSAIVLNDADLAHPASADLAHRLLEGSRDVALLATSRQRLAVYGEHLLPLAGLPVPDLHLRPDGAGPGLTPDLGRLQEQDSVKLFVDRAALQKPGFQLDRTNAAAVFDVCRWLDGLPLAIELAALRLRHMTVADLAARLDDPLPLLSGNAARVPARHVSLETAIGWSFDQLTDEQRTVARRLCRFSTWFRLSDAAEIAHDDGLPAELVNETVLELIDRSFLVWQMDHDNRAEYRWPNAVREYGRRELESGADADRIEKRYTSWLMRVTAPQKKEKGRSEETELSRLADLSPELFAAVYKLPADEQHDAVSRLAGAHGILLQFGHRQGSDLVREIAGRTGSRINVFREAGIAARVRGEWDAADEYLRTAQQAAVTQRDKLGEADTLRDLAENAADRGEYDRAREHATKAESLYRELGDANGKLEVKNLLGKLLLESGDAGGAEKILLEALHDARDHPRLRAYTLHNLGLCDHDLRRIASARDRLARSLEIRKEMENIRGQARLFESFAIIESVLENHAVSLELLGEARQIRRTYELEGMPRRLRDRLARVEAEARAALAETPDEADRLLELGAAMSLEEAAELALDDVDAVFRDPFETPLPNKVLCRRAPDGARTAGDGADPRGGTSLGQALDHLASGTGSAPEVHRRLHVAELLVLGEPIEKRVDALCFALPPDVHRGLFVPVFSDRARLDEVRRLRPEWAAKPALLLRFEQIRSTLLPGETIVINPWLPSEYRWSLAEQGYQPARAEDSVRAPIVPSLASSRS